MKREFTRLPSGETAKPFEGLSTLLEEHQKMLRGSVNRRVANVTTVGKEAIQSFGELSGKKSSQPIDGSS
jgi:hypothetical protein